MLANTCPLLRANKPKAPGVTSANCVCVSWGPALSLQQFDAPRLELKFSNKVLRLQEEKLLASDIKSLRTNALIFTEAARKASQVNTHVCKPRLIPSQNQRKSGAETHEEVNRIKTFYRRRQLHSPRLSRRALVSSSQAREDWQGERLNPCFGSPQNAAVAFPGALYSPALFLPLEAIIKLTNYLRSFFYCLLSFCPLS